MVLGAIFVLGPAVDAGLRLRDMRRELSLASASVDRSRGRADSARALRGRRVA